MMHVISENNTRRIPSIQLMKYDKIIILPVQRYMLIIMTPNKDKSVVVCNRLPPSHTLTIVIRSNETQLRAVINNGGTCSNALLELNRYSQMNKLRFTYHVFKEYLVRYTLLIIFYFLYYFMYYFGHSSPVLLLYFQGNL